MSRRSFDAESSPRRLTASWSRGTEKFSSRASRKPNACHERGATLAKKVRWNNDWSQHVNAKPAPKEPADLLGQLATTAAAVGDRPVEGEDPEESKMPKKKKVKRKHRNPFVQALRETEGKKYASARVG